MTHEETTLLRVNLTETLRILKSLDPYLTPDNFERSSLARFCIRKILEELEKSNQQ